MDGMKEIRGEFLSETKELLEGLDRDLITLEQQPDNLDLINEIFRSIHTIKGGASFLGFDQIVELSHRAENLLNKIRQGDLEIDTDIMDIMLEAVDFLKSMIEDIAQERSPSYQLDPLYRKIEQVVSKEQEVSQEKGEAEEPLTTPFHNLTEEEQEKLRLFKIAPDKTIRIEIERLDNIMNLVGELVLARNRLIRLTTILEEKCRDERGVSTLQEITSNLSLITSDLQLAVMRARMIPIKKVFGKFPRMVRDLARELGKEIELEISGEDTELDKSVIEEIGDPLVHILRNAVDHGIESPEERQAQDKPKSGRIRLSAYHEGNHIIIEIEDDGRGINAETIRVRAIEKGLVDERESMHLSEREWLNFIFLPGFSTSQEATDVSGRGVGLDVVRCHIAKLNGQIDLTTEKGKGTRIRLSIPLTVAIIPALMVGVSSEVFAIPLVSVIEVVRLFPEEITTIKGHEVVYLRNSVLPLIRLGEFFGLLSTDDYDHSNLYIVIIGLAEKRIGIIVEKLYGQEEVVIKTLGNYFADQREITGATITGDGRVVLILDIANLVDQVINHTARDKNIVGILPSVSSLQQARLN
jgi:two-component system chemotaxis sensor kinase CheA